MLTSLDAFGNLDVQASMFNLHLALRIHFRSAQGDITRCTAKAVFQINVDFCMTVLSTRMEAILPLSPGRNPARPNNCSKKSL